MFASGKRMALIRAAVEKWKRKRKKRRRRRDDDDDEEEESTAATTIPDFEIWLEPEAPPPPPPPPAAATIAQIRAADKASWSVMRTYPHKLEVRREKEAEEAEEETIVKNEITTIMTDL
ncbi:unnamed protein product [Fusarium graminearum]|nr:unnamed protein product [Fusarium graminearum]